MEESTRKNMRLNAKELGIYTRATTERYILVEYTATHKEYEKQANVENGDDCVFLIISLDAPSER